MNIQVAVVCDAATDDNGKLNLLGAFDTIFAQEFPATQPQCTVALRVSFMPSDEGQRKLSLKFINADGQPILPPIDMPMLVKLPDDGFFATHNFIVNIQQLKFAETGLYSVDVLIDDKSQASIPLVVKNLPRRPAV